MAEPVLASSSRYDVDAVRSQFPILSERVHGRPLVYLDSAATAQKPTAVIDVVDRFYRTANANVHRGAHALSERATDLYEGARRTVKEHLNARSTREIVFVRGTTEAINLVAQSFARPRLGPDDEILLTLMEHHANIVPWQLVREATGARIRVLPMNERGELELDQLDAYLTDRTKMVGVVHVSNALGTINPVKDIVARAHAKGVPVLLDSAQALPHLNVDVQEIGCDFLAFSGHKVYGPTGIGALYAREELLADMPPYQGGGEMIASVSFEETVYNELPHRFEAGTPNIAGAVGMAAGLKWLAELGVEAVAAHEDALLRRATDAVREVPGLELVGTAQNKASVLSFVFDQIHAHDVGTILDRFGVAVRVGRHCAEPALTHFGLPATARASFAAYNTEAEVDALVEGLHEVVRLFG